MVVFSISGIPVEFQFSTFTGITIHFFISLFLLYHLRATRNLGTWLSASLLSTVLVFASVVLHEAGHALAVTGFGGTIVAAGSGKEAAYIEYYLIDRSWKDALVAFAGPLSDLVFGVSCILFGKYLTRNSVLVGTRSAGPLVLLIGLCNLLPLPQYDGETVFNYLYLNLAPRLPQATVFGVITMVILLASVFVTSGAVAFLREENES